jgi:hypothetical protein
VWERGSLAVLAAWWVLSRPVRRRLMMQGGARGALSTELALAVAILAGLALTVGAVITAKATDAANSIPVR